MKLVILGAGASYDAFYWYRDQEVFNAWRPPLANEIFDTRPDFLNIINSYPSSRRIVSRVATINDLEDYFQQRYEFAKTHNSIDDEKTLINLRFFLQHLFYTITEKLNRQGFSNLDKLVQLINDYSVRTKEDVLIVNFNYDLLMERALCDLFYNATTEVFSIHDYLHHKIKMVKPHGSCNWFRMFKDRAIKPGNNQSLANYLLSQNIPQEQIDEHLDSEFHDAQFNTVTLKGEGGISRNVYPQIFIPLKSKDDFCMPKEQEEYLTKYLEEVSDILIVGWKGNEAHFNNLLKQKVGNKKLNIQIVNGPQYVKPEKAKENLSNYIDTSNTKIFADPINQDFINLSNEEDQHKILKYILPGSLSAFMMNVENNAYHSIFN